MTQARSLIRGIAKRLVYKNWVGFCPICEKRVRFFIKGPWLRDQLYCGECHSIPRERAIMRVIATLYPDWRDLRIHESSPSAGQRAKNSERNVMDTFRRNICRP